MPHRLPKLPRLPLHPTAAALDSDARSCEARAVLAVGSGSFLQPRRMQSAAPSEVVAMPLRSSAKWQLARQEVAIAPPGVAIAMRADSGFVEEASQWQSPSSAEPEPAPSLASVTPDAGLAKHVAVHSAPASSHSMMTQGWKPPVLAVGMPSS